MNVPRARQERTHVEVGYPMVAEVQGHRVLFYRQFGSYQGEWLLFSYFEEHFYIWKDWYGSCSGCDAIEGTFYSSGSRAIDDPEVVEFCKGYHPFLKMAVSSAVQIAEKRGTLQHLLPANLRTELSDEGEANIGRQLALIVKGEAGVISATEILEIDNQETRRIAIERFDAELFIRDVGAVMVAKEGENVLYALTRPEGEEDFVFLYVKDPSTERRYILRVPPGTRTVNAARAFTFGIPEREFTLAEET
jgi:hypothetical protein